MNTTIAGDEDPTGTVTNIWGGPFGNTVVGKQLWLQYMKPQGDGFISVTRDEADGTVTVHCYTHDGNREWGARPIIRIEAGSSLSVKVDTSEDKP